MKAPCLNCKERVLGCHSHCERYTTFAKERERIYEDRLKDLDVNETVAHGIARAQKPRRKRGH